MESRDELLLRAKRDRDRRKEIVEADFADHERALVADYLRLDPEPSKYATGVADLAERWSDLDCARRQLLESIADNYDEQVELLKSDLFDDADADADPAAEHAPLKPCRWCGRERTEEDRRDDGLRLCKDYRACDARRTERQEEQQAAELAAKQDRDGSHGNIPGPWAKKG